MRNSERQLGEDTERRPPRTVKVLGALLMWLEGDRECLKRRWGGLRGSRATPSQNGPPRDQSFLQNRRAKRRSEDAVSHSTPRRLSPLAESTMSPAMLDPDQAFTTMCLGLKACCVARACVCVCMCACLLREVVYPEHRPL